MKKHKISGGYGIRPYIGGYIMKGIKDAKRIVFKVGTSTLTTVFNINAGDTLLVLGDEAQGIAIVKADSFLDFSKLLFEKMKNPEETDE